MIKFIRSVAIGLLILMACLVLLSFVDSFNEDNLSDAIPAKESISTVSLSLKGLSESSHYADGQITVGPAQQHFAKPSDPDKIYTPHTPGTVGDIYYSDAFYLLGGDRLRIIIYADTPQDAGFGFSVYRYASGEEKRIPSAYSTERIGTSFVTIVDINLDETGQFQFVLWNKTDLSQKYSLIFYLR
ncbi:MAG: hypothetical protein AAC993_01910 [Dehalococcoides mccartyi]|uniref:hypothetical protein n=1 Tax=Dehalococcoides mccartyi TaxID=61435 RepID=UPI0030FAB38C